MAYIIVEPNGRAFHANTSCDDGVSMSQEVRLAKRNAVDLGHLTVFNRKSYLHVIGGFPFQSDDQIEAAGRVVATFVGTRVLFEVVNDHQWAAALYPQMQAVAYWHRLVDHDNSSGAERRINVTGDEGDCLPDLG